MRELVYLASVEADFDRILRRITIGSGSLEAGQKFVAELRARCKRVATLPGTLGRARPELLPDLRSFPHKRYIVFFRCTPAAFVVVNILEAARDLDAYFAQDDD